MTEEQIENLINEYAGGLSVLFNKEEVKELILKVLEFIENERERLLPN